MAPGACCLFPAAVHLIKCKQASDYFTAIVRKKDADADAGWAEKGRGLGEGATKGFAL